LLTSCLSVPATLFIYSSIMTSLRCVPVPLSSWFATHFTDLTQRKFQLYCYSIGQSRTCIDICTTTIVLYRALFPPVGIFFFLWCAYLRGDYQPLLLLSTAFATNSAPVGYVFIFLQLDACFRHHTIFLDILWQKIGHVDQLNGDL
jgi:hypothetical protein